MLVFVINILYSNKFIRPGQSRIAAVFPYLQVDFDITRSQVGLKSTFIFISSATISIISGRVVDNIGAKRPMQIRLMKYYIIA